MIMSGQDIHLQYKWPWNICMCAKLFFCVQMVFVLFVGFPKHSVELHTQS